MAASSLQAWSAGTITVATRPGKVRACDNASDPAIGRSRADRETRTKSDTGRAIPATSEVSGAS